MTAGQDEKNEQLTKRLSVPRIIAIILLLTGIALNAYYQVLNGFNVVLSGSIAAFAAAIIVLVLSE